MQKPAFPLAKVIVKIILKEDVAEAIAGQPPSAYLNFFDFIYQPVPPL
jgi:hypothetical protein